MSAEVLGSLVDRGYVVYCTVDGTGFGTVADSGDIDVSKGCESSSCMVFGSCLLSGFGFDLGDSFESDSSSVVTATAEELSPVLKNLQVFAVLGV